MRTRQNEKVEEVDKDTSELTVNDEQKNHNNADETSAESEEK